MRCKERQGMSIDHRSASLAAGRTGAATSVQQGSDVVLVLGHISGVHGHGGLSFSQDLIFGQFSWCSNLTYGAGV